MSASPCIRMLGGLGLGRSWLAGGHPTVYGLLRGSQSRDHGFGSLSMLESRAFVRNVNTTSKDTRIGIIGFGHVGSAVAGNLLREGYQVSAVSDVEKAKLTNLPPSTTRCTSSAQVLNLSDVVVTCLPRPEHVKAVAEGSEGLLDNFSAGKIWVDHSTTDYEQTLEYSSVVEGKGGYLLEAPITGGLEALKKGQMIAFLGGPKDVADALMPIMKASYMDVFYVGPKIGTAMILKVVSNMLCCVNVLAMGEALMLAKRASIDLHTFWDAIRMSAGNSYGWETGGPLIFNAKYDPGFPITLLNKDLQLGYEMARKFKVPMPLNHLTLNSYRTAEYQFGEQAGCYSAPRVLEAALNESLQIPGFSKWNYDNVVTDGALATRHKDIDDNAGTE